MRCLRIYLFLIGILYFYTSPFILTKNNLSDSSIGLRRIKIHSGRSDAISSLKNEPLISQWNLLFSKIAKDASMHPEQYEAIELLFIREDDSVEKIPFFVPNDVSDGDLDITVSYLAAKVNNYIVIHSAKSVYVKSKLENICEKLNSYFQQNYERRDARTTVASMSAIYSGSDNFEILSYQDGEIFEVVNEETQQQEFETQEVSFYYSTTNIVVNIGKTKIKFAIAYILENGGYRLGNVMDLNTWEEGEDRTQYGLIQERVIVGINELLK